MSRVINEIGHKYGKLTVIEKGGKSKNGHQRWICQCECGNLYEAEGSKLRNGTTTHCGCSCKNSIDEIGHRYGRLVVIEKVCSQNNCTKWKCQCDCGNFTEVLGTDLRAGKVYSCGCLNREMASNRFTIDETNNVYGKLTVLKRQGSVNGKAAWLCQCECGNQIIAAGPTLRNDNIHSCGCIKSKGEQQILSYLQAKNISFKKEYSFKDLISDKGGYPRFDFAIFNSDTLVGLIEFQGEQHYKDKGIFGKRQREVTDNLKVEYCKLNNIPLCIIKYNDNILEKLKDFLTF